MTVEDIKTCVDQFRQGALNCIEAGFDGVEVRSVFANKVMPWVHGGGFWSDEIDGCRPQERRRTGAVERNGCYYRVFASLRKQHTRREIEKGGETGAERAQVRSAREREWRRRERTDGTEAGAPALPNTHAPGRRKQCFTGRKRVLPEQQHVF